VAEEKKMSKCLKCGFDNPDSMKFCGECGARLEQAGEISRAERRPVVILFADIVGYTAMSEKMDPEQVQDILNQCFSLTSAVITRYEGTVDKYVGDEVMALFGVPAAHENDPERAMRAALEIREGLKELSGKIGFDIQMRQGLNVGEVVTGAVGGDGKADHTVIGDAVNLASRLEHLAAPGEIAVSEELAWLGKHIFDFSDLGEHQLKGKAETVHAYRLDSVKADRGKVRGIGGLWSPMVGRDRELKSLLDSFDQCARERKSRAVFVIAEPGGGKSRLLQEFNSSLKEKTQKQNMKFTLAFGRCLPFGGASLGPVIEMLRGIFGLRENDEPEAVKAKIQAETSRYFGDRQIGLFDPSRVFNVLLGLEPEESLGGNLTADQLQKQIKLVLVEFFGMLASRSPLLLVVEDLHWADELSLDILEYLVNFHRDLPILFLGLSRPPTQEGARAAAMSQRLVAQGNGFSLHLSELKPEDVRQIIHAMLEIEELPSVVKERIVEYSGGNPLFVEEIIRYLIDQGLLLPAEGYWRAAGEISQAVIPNTLQGLLLSRIDQLPSSQKSIIQHAAVVGKIFWERLVSELMEKEISGGLADLALRDMVRRSLQSSLSDDIEYIFKHILVQEAAYNTILKKFRVNLHAKVVKLIEEKYPALIDQYADLLAYHAERSEDRQKNIHYSILAGDKNRRLHANHQAREFYHRALGIMESDPSLRQQCFDIGIKLSDVCSSLGENDEAISLLNKYLSCAQGPEQEAMMFRKIGENYQRKSKYDQALQHLERAVAKLSTDPNSLEMFNVFRELAWVYYLKGHLDRANNFAAGAVRILDAQKGSDPLRIERARAAASNLLAIFESREGKYDQAIEHHLQQIEILKKQESFASLGAPYNNLGTVYWSKGDIRKALEYLEKSMGIAEKTGEMLSVAISCNNLGGIYLDLNYPEKARRYFERYLDINARIANRLGDAYGHSGLGRLHKSQGELSKAVEEFEISLEVSREVQSRILEASALYNLSDAHCRLGHLDKAEGYYLQAQAVMKETGSKDQDGNPLLEGRILLARAEKGSPEEKTAHLNKARQLLLGQLESGGFSDDEEKPFEFYHLLAVTQLLLGETERARESSQKASDQICKYCDQLDQEMQTNYKAKKDICEILEFGKKLGI
jgi:predicted ATPase/class 3 adenylate cyclase